MADEVSGAKFKSECRRPKEAPVKDLRPEMPCGRSRVAFEKLLATVGKVDLYGKAIASAAIELDLHMSSGSGCASARGEPEEETVAREADFLISFASFEVSLC